MDDMANYPGLEKRNGIYRYRERVPKSLKLLVSENTDKWQRLIRSRKRRNSDWSSVIGKTGQLRESVSCSLRTKEKRKAVPLYHKKATKFEDIYTSITTALTGSKTQPTEWDARNLAKAYFQSHDVADRDSFVTPVERPKEVREIVENDLSIAISQTDQAEYEYVNQTKLMLQENGFDNDPTTEGAKHLLHCLRRADIALGQRNLERLDSNFDPPIFDILFDQTEYQFQAASHQYPSRTFGELFDEYLNEKSREVRSSKTIPGYRFVRRIFDEVIGADKLGSEIRRDDCRKVTNSYTGCLAANHPPKSGNHPSGDGSVAKGRVPKPENL